MGAEYRQAIERAELPIECNTASVPCDGRYYVLHRGGQVGKFKSLKQAQRKYRETLEELKLPPLEISAEERARAQARALANAMVSAGRAQTLGAAASKRSKRSGSSRTFG